MSCRSRLDVGKLGVGLPRRGDARRRGLRRWDRRVWDWRPEDRHRGGLLRARTRPSGRPLAARRL